MALLQENTLFSLLFLLCMAMSVSSHNRPYTTPDVPRLTDLFPHVSIDQGLSKFFGAQNIQLLNNGSYANLALNKSSGREQPSVLPKFTTNELMAPYQALHNQPTVDVTCLHGFFTLYAGSGLVSRSKYHYGFFSAAIKLPAGLSSGVVVAFYLSNADTFPHSHDEIDIELLGHDKRNDWVVQTNIYSNGSVSTGREEKFYFWFDPTQEHHYYSIIWNSHHIVFFVDNIPVREFPSSGAFSSTYPSKPMSVYATIWDGSQWATHGGKYPVNYKYAPFVVSLAEMEMVGCLSDPRQQPLSSCSSKSPSSSSDPVEGQDFAALSQQQIMAMHWARSKLMFYSYCKDTSRFKVMPPECK